MTGELEEHVLERGQFRAEIADPNLVLGQALDHVSDKAVAMAADREVRVGAHHLVHIRQRVKAGLGLRRLGFKQDRSPRAMPGHEALRRVDIDDAAVLDNGHAIAQPLGFFHQVGGHEHGLATRADAADQFPDRPPRLRIEPRRQFIKKDHLGIVDEGQGNEQPLLLAPRQGHEPGVALVGEAELFEQAIAVADRLLVERRPQVDRLPYLDALLQVRLLQLHADALLQLVDVAKGIQAQHRDGAPIGLADALDALHGGGLAGAVRADQAKNLALVDVERHLVDRDGRPVGLANALDGDDGVGHPPTSGRTRYGSSRRAAGRLP